MAARLIVTAASVEQLARWAGGTLEGRIEVTGDGHVTLRVDISDATATVLNSHEPPPPAEPDHDHDTLVDIAEGDDGNVVTVPRLGRPSLEANELADGVSVIRTDDWERAEYGTDVPVGAVDRVTNSGGAAFVDFGGGDTEVFTAEELRVVREMDDDGSLIVWNAPPERTGPEPEPDSGRVEEHDPELGDPEPVRPRHPRPPASAGRFGPGTCGGVILATVAEDPERTYTIRELTEAAEQAGFTANTVRVTLTPLFQEGLIARPQPGQYQHVG